MLSWKKKIHVCHSRQLVNGIELAHRPVFYSGIFWLCGLIFFLRIVNRIVAFNKNMLITNLCCWIFADQKNNPDEREFNVPDIGGVNISSSVIAL